jgi:hypothetical protein
MARYRFLGFAVLMTALCFMTVVPGEGAMPDRVSFAGVNTPATLKAGKSSEVTLRFVIVPGFHINSNAPKSDLLIPTTLKIDSAGAVTAKSIAYAEGKDVAFPFDPDSKLNVYTGEFTVRAALFVPVGTPAGTLPVHGELRYQACSDRSCFPPKTLALDFSVTVEQR